MVYEWYMLFEELFLIYKYMEIDEDIRNKPNPNWRTFAKLINVFSTKINDEPFRKVFNYFNSQRKDRKMLNSERFFNEITHEIGKAQANYTFAKYSLAMAKESYEKALQMHHEGKAYKDMISQMHYLDDDLKNDTIQFSSAIERYKINNDYIKKQLDKINGIISVR